MRRLILASVAVLLLTGAPAQAQNCVVVNGVMVCANGATFKAPVFLPGTSLTWAASGASTADLVLAREGANYLIQRNGTSAQRFSVANTYTSATSNELFSVDWQTTANVARVGTFTAATGTSRSLRFLAQSSNASDSYATLNIQSTSIGFPVIRGGLLAGALTNAQTGVTGNFMQFAEGTSTATSGQFNAFALVPTYNQSSGTAANTDLLINRTETAVGSGVQRLLDLQTGSTSRFAVTAGGATGRATQLTASQATAPTCSSNCGTSPSVVGSDFEGRVTMGSSGVPASGWVVTFNGTWANAPHCNVWASKTGMVVGKMPIVVATATTTLTVTTNGTAPATTDTYDYRCTSTP